MKKYLIATAALIIIGLSSFGINVPKAVSAAFEKKFPLAVNIKWAKENAKEYEAEFMFNGRSLSANFLTDGSWVETETEVTISELPAAVIAAINNKKPGATITKSYKIETAKGEISYEAEIKTGNKKSELILKADGTIVK